MQTETNYTGIDISKLTLDVAIPDGSHYRHYKFRNEEADFQLLLKALPKQSHVVMEASGHDR